MLAFFFESFALIGVIGLLTTIFWIWALVDCIQTQSNQNNEKLIWVLIIIFTHFLGALLYFLLKKQR
jgi:hypothetical protein